jgi:hypothetical protein
MQFAQSHIAVTNTRIHAWQRAPHTHSTESITCISLHSIQALLRLNKCLILPYAMTTPKYNQITSASAMPSTSKVSSIRITDTDPPAGASTSIMYPKKCSFAQRKLAQTRRKTHHALQASASARARGLHAVHIQVMQHPTDWYTPTCERSYL